MDRPELLLLVVVVSLLGGILVAWSGVLVANAALELSAVFLYAAIAIILLVLLLPLWNWYGARGGDLI